MRAATALAVSRRTWHPMQEDSTIKLSAAQYEVYEKEFRAIDENGNGRLEQSECEELLALRLDRQPLPGEIESFFRQLNRSSNGMISLEDYITSLVGSGWQVEGKCFFDAKDSYKRRDKANNKSNVASPTSPRTSKYECDVAETATDVYQAMALFESSRGDDSDTDDEDHTHLARCICRLLCDDQAIPARPCVSVRTGTDTAEAQWQPLQISSITDQIFKFYLPVVEGFGILRFTADGMAEQVISVSPLQAGHNTEIAVMLYPACILPGSDRGPPAGNARDIQIYNPWAMANNLDTT